ncbi:unnamed protein product [Periconia digitata]|uniref:Uncharacterized protein n=1 Tax=Periconia digitata TaxID=1303443 RepID=A0A9W4UAE7_9PLEO|nr:unnamed protein product [Periconia digitata]
MIHRPWLASLTTRGKTAATTYPVSLSRAAAANQLPTLKSYPWSRDSQIVTDGAAA